MPTSFKLAGIGFILFVFGFYNFQAHLRMSMWGIKVQAEIVNVFEVERRRSKRLDVLYSFEDANKNICKGTFPAPTTWVPPPGGKVDIIYLPYDTSVHKLATDSSMPSLLGTIGGICLMAFAFYYFMYKETVLDAHRATQRALDGDDD